jgi:ribosomal protein S18 acetylase RimI-like enzyme
MVQFKVNDPISVEQFFTLLNSSTLAERRPTDDRDCLKGMIENSNLLVSAWQQKKLIGLARCMTDFHYACYLSDLAVSAEYQKKGIGKQLQKIVQEQLGPRCKLILIAAPNANTYYEHLGFTNNSRCWVLDRSTGIRV